MIVAKPGSSLPSLMSGEQVYVIYNTEDGMPVAAGLHYPAVCVEFTKQPDTQFLDIATVKWVG